MFADYSGRTECFAKGNMKESVTQLIKTLEQKGLGLGN